MAHALSDNMRGALWMLASSVFFATSGLAIKIVGAELPVPVVAFFRVVFGLIFIVPFLLKYGPKIFYTKQPGWHLLRLAGSSGSILFGFYAITHLPYATAVSLSFTRPLFIILIGLIFLGEVVRWRRGLATVAGFLGVVIMLGPTDIGFTLPALSALAGAASVSVALAVIRKHAATEGHAFMSWFFVGSVVLLGPIAAYYWETPQGIQWAYLAYIGIIASAGQYCLIRSLMIAEATVVSPVDYIQIIIAAAAGYVLFSEKPTIWTGIGAVVIVAATLYILFREASLKTHPAANPAIKE
ncbi:MAG: DMT family transporter [Rhodospirillaceae bacterium]